MSAISYEWLRLTPAMMAIAQNYAVLRFFEEAVLPIMFFIVGLQAAAIAAALLLNVV
jgi:hypothetical protein